jgi:mRNA interferase MazF
MAIHEIRRYNIFLANLNPTLGVQISKMRPVVVVSRNELNLHLQTVTVCPLTTRLHPHWQGRLQIVNAGKRAEIAVDQIRTIDKKRLQKKIDHLAERDASELRRLISEAYCAPREKATLLGAM